MILMHAGQPGTRRRTLAKTSGVSHSTIVEYEGDENEITQAIRQAARPASNNMALFAKPRAQFGMQPGARNRQHAKLREVEPSEVREEKSTMCSVEVREEVSMSRRANHVIGKEQWYGRGLFKLGFNSGSPRVRSARKFTK